MKVKIGDKVFDSNIEPIMLILSDDDKKNINAMHLDKHNFISYPSEMKLEDIRNWINKD